MFQKNTFEVISEEGKTIECIVLFTHFDEKFHKHYVVYTPAELTNGPTQLYAAIYTPVDGKITDFQEIKSDEEWAMIESKIKELQDAIKGKD